MHRLGQQRPVHVIHFVASGTIEHGMLDLLQFKKSLFAGVLDGGQDEVFMGGTRLKRFMESVESATKQIPAAPAFSTARDEPAGAGDAGPALNRPASAPQPAGDPWAQLIAAGKTALDALAQAIANPANGDAPAAGLRFDRDPVTGQSYLKLPVPSSEVIGRAVLWLQALAGALQPDRQPVGR